MNMAEKNKQQEQICCGIMIGAFVVTLIILQILFYFNHGVFWVPFINTIN